MSTILMGSAATGTSGLIGLGGKFAASQALMTGGALLGAAGAMKSGAVAEAQAKSAQNMAEHNARVQEREAEARRQQALYEQKAQMRRAKRNRGSLIAGMAASGGLGSPIAADLAAEQAAESELENLITGYEGELSAARAESQAEIDRLSGKLARKKGANLKTASYWGAGESLLTGFGSAYSG